MWLSTSYSSYSLRITEHRLSYTLADDRSSSVDISEASEGHSESEECAQQGENIEIRFCLQMGSRFGGRFNRYSSQGRRIEFDPLALLLDAALEGQVDLVKESAAKVRISSREMFIFNLGPAPLYAPYS